MKHIGRASVYGRDAEAMAHLAEVNGWTEARASRYVEAQGAVWLQRSQHEWTLDLDALAQYGPPLPPSSRRRRCDVCEELFPVDQLTVHDDQRLCEYCLDEEVSGWGYEMWPDHEMPPLA